MFGDIGIVNDNYLQIGGGNWWEQGYVHWLPLNYFAPVTVPGQDPELDVEVEYKLRHVGDGPSPDTLEQMVRLIIKNEYTEYHALIDLSGSAEIPFTYRHKFNLSNQWNYQQRGQPDRFNQFVVFMTNSSVSVNFIQFKINNIQQHGLLAELKPNHTWQPDVSYGLQPDTDQLEEGFWDISNVDYNGITVTEFQETASAPDHAQLVFVNPHKTLYPLYKTNDYKIEFYAYVADGNGSIPLTLRAEEWPHPYSLHNNQTEEITVSADGFENKVLFSVPLSTLLDNVEPWREYNKLMFRIGVNERKIGITDIRIVLNE